VAAVERISEAYLLPVIQMLLESFPFEIRGFHSDSKNIGTSCSRGAGVPGTIGLPRESLVP
jgi:hypothetical protein